MNLWRLATSLAGGLSRWATSLARGRRHRAAEPPPPLDLSRVENHLARTDQDIEKGATELDYLRVQLRLIRRDWEQADR